MRTINLKYANLLFYGMKILLLDISFLFLQQVIKYSNMRSSSTSKKRIQPQTTRYIENKIFISSKHVNPLSSTIASKLDIIKQQISRQLHEKMSTTKKKPSTSLKKTYSTSKMRSATITPQQETKFVYEDSFREKYYYANEQYLNEKKKVLEAIQLYNEIKQNIIRFLDDPCKETGENLSNIVGGQKAQKQIEKFINLSDQITTYQNSLIQIMNVMQVQDLQTLMQQLRKRGSRFSNLDSCHFKIMELEATNNQINADFQTKLLELKKQYQQEIEDEKQKVQKQIHYLKNSLKQFEKKLENQNLYKNQLKNDFKLLIDNWQNRQIKWNTQSSQLRDIHIIILNLNTKIIEIQQQAKDNISKIQRSSEQMIRLSNILQQMKKQFEMQEQQERIRLQQKNSIIETLSEHMRQKDKMIHLQKDNINNLQKQHQQQINTMNKNKQQLQSYFDILSHNLDIDKDTQKVLSRVIDMKQKIGSLQQLLSWHEKQLSTKQSLLKQFSYNIETLISQSKHLKVLNKTISNERQQYKFLLTNLREQIIQIKKQNQIYIQSIIKEKDNQIVESNKDILQVNQKISRQFKDIKIQYEKVLANNQQYKSSIQFQTKKLQHLEKSLQQKTASLIKLEEQNKKYKNHLNDIQSSLKQVENYSARATQQVKTLQQQRQQRNNQFNDLQRNYKKLQGEHKCKHQQCQNMISINNQLKQQVKDLKDSNQKTQKINSDLRLALLERDSYIRQNQDDQKRLKKQILELKSESKKNIEKISILNKKNNNKQQLHKKLEKKQSINKGLMKMKAQIQQLKRQLIQSISTEKSFHTSIIIKIKQKYNLHIVGLSQQYDKLNLKYINKQQLLFKISNQSEQYKKELLNMKKQFENNQKNMKQKQQQYQKQIIQINKTNTLLQQQLKKANNEKQFDLDRNNQSNDKINVLIKKIEQLDKQVLYYRQQSKQHKNNLQQLSQKYKQKCSECTAFETINNELQTKLIQQQNRYLIENNKFGTQLENKQAEIHALNKKISNNKQEITKYEDIVKNKNQDIKKLEDNITKLKDKQNLQKLQPKIFQKQQEDKLTKQHYRKIIKNIFNQLLTLKQQLLTLKQTVEITKNEQLILKDKLINCINNLITKNKQHLLLVNDQSSMLKGQLQQLKLVLENWRGQFPQIIAIIQQEIYLKVKDILRNNNKQIQVCHNNNENNQELNAIRQTDQQQELSNQNFEESFHSIGNKVNQQIKSQGQEGFNKYIKKSSFCQVDINSQSIERHSDDNGNFVDQAVIIETQRQILNIIQILTKLKQQQQPDIPYFNQIRKQYEDIKKLLKKQPNLKLDVSNIQSKVQSVSSPTSFSFLKDFVQERRLNSQPADDLKDSHRSEHYEKLKSVNQYKLQIKQLQEQLEIIKQNYEYQQIHKRQLEQKIIQLENSNSIQTLQKLFERFIKSMLQQKIQQLQSTLRIILKILMYTQKQVLQIQQKIEAKKKKKNNGFFTNFWK